jgi:crotonobetaine/carnitine-CoA ligase
VTIDGERLSFGEAGADAARAAGFFAELGVRPGQMVVVLMPNGLDFVRVWLGLGRLGAVAVLLNTELRGAFLRHQLENCGAELAVIDRSLLDAVREIAPELSRLRRVVVTGDPPTPAESFAILPWDQWRSAAPYQGPSPRAHDIACIMYTSGTSGPSKGVLMPHAHCYLFGLGTIDTAKLGPDDRYYVVLPLFHANGLLMQIGATLIAGASAVLRPRFSASAWIDDVRTHGATVTNSLGALAAFVVAQPPTPRDRDHRLRAIMSAPNVPLHEAIFRERFGIAEVLSGYGMTEVNIPVWGRIGTSTGGGAGWVYEPYFEVIVADPTTDEEVPPGQIGEILVRPKVPSGFMAGYHGMPEKTVEAWRNLWFHSGDAGTMAADGLLTFVDRIKDCIRRRGENISAAEVEAAIGGLAGVAEIAAFAVPSEVPGGEDEVMLAIVAEPGASLTREDVAAQADRVLPRYARPRFIELVDSLPKTATGKVQRAELRKRGVATAWDRDTGARG